MKTLLSSFLTLLITLPAMAGDIPNKWLEGVKGYEKAMELQKTTKQPIVVWTTWNTCGNCKAVAEHIDESKFKRGFKEYIKVVLDERSKDEEEVTLCKKNGFGGGTFYVLKAGSETPTSSFWAWKQGSYTLIDDLESRLTTDLAAAKAP